MTSYPWYDVCHTWLSLRWQNSKLYEGIFEEIVREVSKCQNRTKTRLFLNFDCKPCPPDLTKWYSGLNSSEISEKSLDLLFSASNKCLHFLDQAIWALFKCQVFPNCLVQSNPGFLLGIIILGIPGHKWGEGGLVGRGGNHSARRS